MTNPPEQKAAQPEACPRCGSRDKNIRLRVGVMLRHECTDPWHDALPVEPPATKVMSERNSHPDDGGPERVAWEVSLEERFAQVAARIAAEISETKLTSFSRSPKIYAGMVEIIVKHLMAAEPAPGVQQGAEQPLTLEQRIMLAMHITWNEETEFEVPAEPEPQYFGTLAEAIEFWVKLANVPEQAHATASPAENAVGPQGGGYMKMATENAELKAKIAELNNEIADLQSALDENWIQHQRVVKAERERDQASEALRKLANYGTVRSVDYDGDIELMRKLAREALAAVPPSEDAPATHQPSNLSEMPLNRDCAKCGWTHMVGTDCPPPQAAFVGSESQQQCAASDEYMRGWNEAEATYQSVIAEHWKTYHAEPAAQPSEKEAKPDNAYFPLNCREVRRGFGEFYLSDLKPNEFITASGLRDGGYIVWEKEADQALKKAGTK